MNENTRNKKPTIIVIALMVLLVAVLTVFLIVKNLNSKNTTAEPDDTAEEEVFDEEDYLTEDEADPDEIIEEDNDEPVSVTEWPAGDYPDIPVFEAGEYQVRDLGDKIEIFLNSEDAAKLPAYAEELVKSGATVSFEDEFISFYNIGDIELQLFKFETSPKIVLCAEETIEFEADGFGDFILPESGRLVNAEVSGSGALSLTYRGFSYEAAKEYAEKLIAEGYTTDSNVPGEMTSFMMTFVSGDKHLIVDFHGAVSDVMISLSKTEEAASESSNNYLYDEETGHNYYVDENGKKVIIYAEGDNILSDEEDDTKPKG